MRLDRRIIRVLKNPHLIRQRLNRPRPEDYLPYSTTHQHRPTWKWPFLSICACMIVMLWLIIVLLGKQAQQAQYIEDTRHGLCDTITLAQKTSGRELYRAYQELDCEQYARR